MPAFVAIADSLGRAIELPFRSTLGIMAALIAFHVAYWSRQRWAKLPGVPQNALLNHVFLFMSRLSFIFAAAFFSLVAFRHLPALANAPDLVVMAARGSLLIAILFSLFCYSLEIERIGREMEPAEGLADE